MPSYEKFLRIYNQLPVGEKCIIINVLQEMKHKIDIKEIDIKNGIDLARKEYDLSEKDLINEIKEACKNTMEYDFNFEETYKSMVKRNSINSKLFPVVLKILNIDMKYIIQHSKYFYEHIADLEWLYSTLSKYNKGAIYTLANDLLYKPKGISIEELMRERTNVGVEEMKI